MVAFLVTFVIVLAVLLSAVFVNLFIILHAPHKGGRRQRNSDYSRLDDMLFN